MSAANSRIQKIYRFLHFYLFIYFIALNSSPVWILISSAFGNCYHCNSTQLHNNEKKNLQRDPVVAPALAVVHKKSGGMSEVLHVFLSLGF